LILSFCLTPIIGLFIVLFSPKKAAPTPSKSLVNQILGILLIGIGTLSIIGTLKSISDANRHSDYYSNDYSPNKSADTEFSLFLPCIGILIWGYYVFMVGRGKNFSEEIANNNSTSIDDELRKHVGFYDENSSRLKYDNWEIEQYINLYDEYIEKVGKKKLLFDNFDVNKDDDVRFIIHILATFGGFVSNPNNKYKDVTFKPELILPYPAYVILKSGEIINKVSSEKFRTITGSGDMRLIMHGVSLSVKHSYLPVNEDYFSTNANENKSQWLVYQDELKEQSNTEQSDEFLEIANSHYETIKKYHLKMILSEKLALFDISVTYC
jgi:hypothetical protein